MTKTPAFSCGYNTLSPFSWFMLIFGCLLILLAPVFYAIKPDDPTQFTMPIVMGVPLVVLGFVPMLKWGRLEVFDDRIKLTPKLKKSRTEELLFSEIQQIKVEEGKSLNFNLRIFQVGGKEIFLNRIIPSHYPGLIWLAWRFHSILPPASFAGIRAKGKYRDFPEKLKIGGRSLRKQSGQEFSDTGVLVPLAESVVYIPVMASTKGPGLLASIVSPVQITTYLLREGVPNPSHVPVMAVVLRIWNDHKIRLEQKEKFFESLSAQLFGNRLKEFPPVMKQGEPVILQMDEMECAIGAAEKHWERMAFI